MYLYLVSFQRMEKDEAKSEKLSRITLTPCFIKNHEEHLYLYLYFIAVPNKN